MKNFLLGLALILSGAFAQATYIPQNCDVKIDGTCLKSQGLIKLRGVVSGVSVSATSFREGNASAGYTPSGANNFRVVAYRVITQSAYDVTLSYNDVDRGITSNTSSVNPIYWNDSTGADPEASLILNSSQATGVYHEGTLDFLVPNGKYVSADRINAAGQNATIDLYGYEEP